MNKNIKYLILILTLIFMLALLSLSLGSIFISPEKMWSIFTQNKDLPELQILLRLRLPRLVMSITLGASLAVSGVIFQSLLKNPLSDPFTIGVSSGSALGAAVGIILNLNNIWISSLALGGGLAVTSLVYLVARHRQMSTATLVLSGISLNFILSSLILLIFSLVKSEQVHKILLWMMGDLSIARYTTLWKATPFMIIIIFISYFYHRHLDLISLGDELSSSTGVTKQEKQNLFWLASILAAIPVALAGVIGFVGLIIPHLVRYLFGYSHKKVIIFSSFLGACFLIICDIIARSIAPPYEIPLGVITGLLGGTFFFMIIIFKRKAV